MSTARDAAYAFTPYMDARDAQLLERAAQTAGDRARALRQAGWEMTQAGATDMARALWEWAEVATDIERDIRALTAEGNNAAP